MGEQFNRQAPRLVNNKPKVSNNHIQIDTNMFGAICNDLKDSPKTVLLLIYLIGQADGFKITIKNVCDKIGCGKASYYKMRDRLEENGYIICDNNCITINYNKIQGLSEIDS